MEFRTVEENVTTKEEEEKEVNWMELISSTKSLHSLFICNSEILCNDDNKKEHDNLEMMNLTTQKEDDVTENHECALKGYQIVQQELLSYIPQFKEVIQKYINYILHANNNSVGDASFDRKKIILETRKALRFALVLSSPPPCSSSQDGYKSVLNDIQNECIGIQIIHHELSNVILLQDQQPAANIDDSKKGLLDRKCCKMACQILCNLGTRNRVTAKKILEWNMRHQIKQPPSLLSLDQTAEEEEDKDTRIDSTTNSMTEWGRMIAQMESSLSENRETLAALVATIHNCLVSLQCTRTTKTATVNLFEIINEEEEDDTNEENDAEEDSKNSHFNEITKVLAQDKVLMCNLIRHIVPCTSATTAATSSSFFETSTNRKDDNKEEKEIGRDGATDWIIPLFEKICCLGSSTLPLIYKSLGGGADTSTTTTISESDFGCADNENSEHSRHSVTPEQVVFLHCIQGCMEEYSQSVATSSSNISTTMQEYEMNRNPLGIEELEVISFLVEEWKYLQKRLETLHIGATDMMEEEWYNGEKSCIEVASSIIIEFLATSLEAESHDNDKGSGTTMDGSKARSLHAAAMRRLYLSQKTSLFTDALLTLGRIVDHLGKENQIGTSNNSRQTARELQISSGQQRMMIGLIQLVGNACYQCRWNQDLLRTTHVPILLSEEDAKGFAFLHESATDHDENHNNIGRNGLHVLLSCTSFAHGCFTLREWVVIAIRNALFQNDENQRELEKLETQQTIDTPELQRLGVQVDLDKKGKIHVTPRDK